MKRNYSFVTFNLLLLWVVFIDLNAQVTIGLGSPPLNGALLQLKEEEVSGGEANSSKGLLMPRVNLTQINKLYPMLETSPGSGLPNAEYSGSTNELDQNQKHLGLVVYNINPCAPFGIGFYVWNGEKWTGIKSGAGVPANPLQNVPSVLNIPSGHDTRSMTVSTLSFSFLTTVQPIWSSPLINSIGGGLQFSNYATQMTPASLSWTQSPAVLSVLPNAFSTASVMTNPWRTQESKTTITVPVNLCGGLVTKEITLNQTNYAIEARNAFGKVTDVIKIENATTSGVNVLANVKWQASAQGALTSVLSTYSQSITGSDLSNGTSATNNFSYTGIAGTAGTRYKTVGINLVDVSEGRAKDFVLTFIQCKGSVDMNSPNIVDANPTQTAAGSPLWAGKVVHHQAKSSGSIYEEFWSAEFGVAGRWMITNLSASSYDSNVASPPTLSGPTTTQSTTVPFWCYPNPSDPTSPNALSENSQLGLLYNFAAATAAKKNGVSANQRGVNTPNLQGICPNGWHLPSDYEWTILENEIINNTTKYAYVQANLINQGVPLVAQGVPGPHGPLASPMTDACQEFTDGMLGTSKSPVDGGFNALFAGYSLNNMISDYEYGAYFWTSSTHNANDGIDRLMYNDDPNMITFEFTRQGYMSVRCKKD